ncbi:uncharacterized protein [Haliotis cracherodii]
MIVIQLWQTTSGADPPPVVQKQVKVCFNCNDRTANFNWTHPLKSLYRIQWKFKDMYIANYTGTALDFSQEALRIHQNYKGRFNLLKPVGVGFNLTNVTRADIGNYRCIVTLRTGVGETLEGVLEERYTDRQIKVEVCNDGNATFKLTRGNMSFSLIRWQVNGKTFASTTKTGFSTDSLNITADYKPRFRLLKQGDVGFQLDHVSRNDAGTYTCIITSQSPEFTILGELEVKDQQSGDFNITVNNQVTLTCGESRDSTYSWIFSNTTGRENETSTGHELPLSYIPQKGSVYCQRHSDCTSSLTFSFSSGVKICMQMSPCDHNDQAMRQDVSAGEAPEEGGSNTAAIVVPIVIVVIIIIIIVTVIILRKRRRERGRISRETGGGEAVRGVEEQML